MRHPRPHVDHKTIGAMRIELEPVGEIPHLNTRTRKGDLMVAGIIIYADRRCACLDWQQVFGIAGS